MINLESGGQKTVLKVSRTFTDAITQEIVVADNEFITKLTHESYTIQIPRLRHDQRKKLEEVVEVFSQDNISDNLHKMEFLKQPKNPLAKKIIKRLSKAAASQEIQRTMEAEDMIEHLINRESEEKLSKQAQEYEEIIQQKEEEFEGKRQRN